jgi:integrase/recombinase XerD
MVRQEPLTPAELDRLLESAKEKSLRDYALILVTHSHGLRASEVGRIRLNVNASKLAKGEGSLDTEHWTLTMRREKGSHCTVDRVLPSGIKLRDEKRVLEAWLKVRPDGAFLFSNRQGAELSRISVYSIFKAAADDARLPKHKASPHSAKHTLGQTLHDQGASIETVAAVLGHKRVDSSARYFEVSREDADEARRRALSAR